jgi:homoserine dehydrogenase
MNVGGKRRILAMHHVLFARRSSLIGPALGSHPLPTQHTRTAENEQQLKCRSIATLILASRGAGQSTTTTRVLSDYART